jgi:hypothetical protein
MDRGRRVAIMDVILDSRARLDLDDLRDAIAQCQRNVLGRPSPEDDSLADMFVPGRYEARQAAFWEDAIADALVDYSPNSIYNVSAERSTACWGTSLDSDGSSEHI